MQASTQPATVHWLFHLGQMAAFLSALSVAVLPQLLYSKSTTRTVSAWKAGGGGTPGNLHLTKAIAC